MSAGFPPIARPDARILILGSLPGQRSIAAGEYYAHPRNAFWQIMHELIGADGTYESRCAGLVEAHIALWDVLRQSARAGSMDANIRVDTSEANDFAHFFSRHRHIEKICFNGRKAESLFGRLVRPKALQYQPVLELLPSTSPAYASMPFEAKLEKWRSAVAM